MHLPAWTGLWSSLFLLLPTVTGALACCCFASSGCFAFAALASHFPVPSAQWNLSPSCQKCGLRSHSGIGIEDPWLYGGTGYATEVPLHCPPPRDASPVNFHAQPKSSWTCSWHDEQRLPLFSEDARQLLHTQALLHRVCTLLHMRSLLIEVNASNY